MLRYRLRPAAQLAVISIVSAAISLTVSAQGESVRQYAPAASTYQGSAAGGWSGPCEDWWTNSPFSFTAMRVCRVTSYLVNRLSPNPDSADILQAQRTIANQMFRICWGTYPSAEGPCDRPNAWVRGRGWVIAKERKLPAPPPVVITLVAAERLQADDEVAFILAHEMGHASDPVPLVPASITDPTVEQRADALGIVFMMRAGYDPRSAGRGLLVLEGQRGQGVLGNLAGMLNHIGAGMTTHGFASDRIERMKQAFARECADHGNKPIGCKDGWK